MKLISLAIVKVTFPGGERDPVPLWGGRGLNLGGFSAPVQTGPGTHPASFTMGTESSQGVKRPRHGADHSSPYSATVKEKHRYLYSFSGLSWPVLEWTLLTITLQLDTRNTRNVYCQIGLLLHKIKPPPPKKSATKRRIEMVIWKQNLFPRISPQKLKKKICNTKYRDWQTWIHV